MSVAASGRYKSEPSNDGFFESDSAFTSTYDGSSRAGSIVDKAATVGRVILFILSVSSLSMTRNCIYT